MNTSIPFNLINQNEHYYAPGATIIVTGACGFVGSIMSARLNELGYSVVAIDNNSRGLNKLSLLKLPNVEYIERDCLDGIPDIIERYNENLCGIFHFAAATGDLTRPDSELYEINTEMTKNIVKNLVECCNNEVIFNFPTTSLALAVPDSGYVKSKEAAIDWLISDDCPLNQNRMCLYRFFNNAGGYGPFGEKRIKEVHFFPRLFHSLMTGRVFTVNGQDYDTIDGTPARDYVHVLDTVDFLIYRFHKFMFDEPFWDDFPEDIDDHSPYLCEIGRSDPYTVMQILKIFNDIFDRIKIPNIKNLLDIVNMNLHFGPRRNFDCGSIQVTEASSRFLKWRPLKTIEDIIIDSFNCYYNYNLETEGKFLEHIIPNKV